MLDQYLPRTIEPILERARDEFPAVTLIGPRQSGKTTTLLHLYPHYTYLSLEVPDIRAIAMNDPRGFLDSYPPPVIFDEIQYAPELLPYIKEKIDQNRKLKGQYLLTGSQNLLLMQRLSESLAGRTAILTLLPLSWSEMSGRPDHLPYWENPSQSFQPAFQHPDNFWKALLRGNFPEIVSNPQRDYRLWYASYVQTYLERDVRNLRSVGDLARFQIYLRALAQRNAQLLNLSEVARDVGISVSTAKDWLSILEATYQIFLLRPYHVNIGKRLVKSPKLYFVDSGLVCYLVGLRDFEHARSGPMGGALFENVVISEVYKNFLHRGEQPPIYFWKTSSGQEVDVLIETERRLIPIEIKPTSTPRPELAKGLIVFQQTFPEKSAGGLLVHLGSHQIPLGHGAQAIPFHMI